MTPAATRKILAEGKHIRLVEEDGWEYAERVQASGIAVIVAVTPEGRLLLVEQYRRPVKARVLELPAGLAGDIAGQESEDLTDAARRELLEETGYEAATMVALTAGPPTAGLATEIVTFFRATGLRKTGPGGGDATEGIVVHEVPVAEVESWCRARATTGVLVDPKVYAGLYFAGQRP
jgi:ADP-ribose pyrophosphatase